MRYVLWSAKGGSGCTTGAVGLATELARSSNSAGVLIVDLAGDCPAAMGLEEPACGLSDWLADATAPVESLGRIELDAGPSLALLALGGSTSWSGERAALFEELLLHDQREIVIDCGTLSILGKVDQQPSPLSNEISVPTLSALRSRFVASADRSILCSRACYLSLRKFRTSNLATDGVLLLCELGRSLNRRDVAAATGAPIAAAVDSDPAVARAVDAGTLTARAPRSWRKQIRELIDA